MSLTSKDSQSVRRFDHRRISCKDIFMCGAQNSSIVAFLDRTPHVSLFVSLTMHHSYSLSIHSNTSKKIYLFLSNEDFSFFFRHIISCKLYLISNNLASFRLHNLYFLSKIKKKSYISACFTRFRPFAAFSIRTLSLYKVFSIFIFRSWFRFISVGNEIGTNSSCQKDLLSRSFKMFGHNLKLGCAFVFFKGYNLEINFSFIFLELLRIWPLFFRQC